MNLADFLKDHSGSGNSEYLIKCTRCLESDEEEEELKRSVCNSRQIQQLYIPSQFEMQHEVLLMTSEEKTKHLLTIQKHIDVCKNSIDILNTHSRDALKLTIEYCRMYGNAADFQDKMEDTIPFMNCTMKTHEEIHRRLKRIDEGDYK